MTCCARSANSLELRTQHVMERSSATALVCSGKRNYFSKKLMEARSSIAKTSSLLNQLRGVSVNAAINEVIDKKTLVGRRHPWLTPSNRFFFQRPV